MSTLFIFCLFQKEIKDAYLRLSKHWHPDLHQNAEDDSAKVAESKFREILSAYEVLSDPNKRRLYDAQIGLAEPERPSTSSPFGTARQPASRWTPGLWDTRRQYYTWSLRNYTFVSKAMWLVVWSGHQAREIQHVTLLSLSLLICTLSLVRVSFYFKIEATLFDCHESFFHQCSDRILFCYSSTVSAV